MFRGLIDSGSLDCFLDSNFVSINKLRTWEIDPLPLTLIDSTVMETLDSTELLMEDQAWLDYLWDFETREINLDLSSDTD